ncbi:hypothetical protein TNCV_2117151 [Trichonephila clavipes]|nr:hypothetical protein TNCV_2117151 [Trichonephila clavipes]
MFWPSIILLLHGSLHFNTLDQERIPGDSDPKAFGHTTREDSKFKESYDHSSSLDRLIRKLIEEVKERILRKQQVKFSDFKKKYRVSKKGTGAPHCHTRWQIAVCRSTGNAGSPKKLLPYLSRRWSSAPETCCDVITEDSTYCPFAMVSASQLPKVGKIQSTLPMMWGQWFSLSDRMIRSVANWLALDGTAYVRKHPVKVTVDIDMLVTLLVPASLINGRRAIKCVANGTMSGQRYTDEVLLPHVVQHRGAVGDKFGGRQRNMSIRTLAVRDYLD